MCSEKSCSLGSDSKELEGFLACGRQQDRTILLLVTPGHHFTEREGKAVYATGGHDVLCNMAQIDLTGLVPCSH